MRTTIAWLKNDLRLHDNELLHRAVGESDKLIPLYIIEPEWFKETSLGFKKTGAFRAQFLVESLENLRTRLKEIGGDLVIRTGRPEQIIPQLASENGVKKVFTSKEVTYEEQVTIDKTEKALAEKSIILDQVWQSTLMHEEDVPWPLKFVPDVFTDFRKEAERETEVRSLYETPKHIQLPEIDAGGLPGLEDFTLTSETTDDRAAINFKGGETEALKRIQEYFWDKDLLRKYKYTRNGLIGADYSSKLSPWLANGSLSPRYVYHEIKKYEKDVHKNVSTYWLFFELMWRDFFRFMAKKYGSNIFQYSGIKGTPPPVTGDHEAFEKWKNGETGESFVDANMLELKHTGFMSNRGRQNVASYLMYDLGVDWTWGAMWFENRLVDYDPCSNWLNWAYIAGVGNDPRQGRKFNIESQQQRYDGKGEYTDLWLNSEGVY